VVRARQRPRALPWRKALASSITTKPAAIGVEPARDPFGEQPQSRALNGLWPVANLLQCISSSKMFGSCGPGACYLEDGLIRYAQ